MLDVLTPIRNFDVPNTPSQYWLPPRRKFHVSEGPTCPLRVAPMLEVRTYVGSSDVPSKGCNCQTFPVRVQFSWLQSKLLWSHGKHVDFILGRFPTGKRPPPLYIAEEIKDDWGTTIHNRSKLNPLLSPTFTPLNPCCAAHLSARLIAVLGGLPDPRKTSPCPSTKIFSGGVRELFERRTGVYTTRLTYWSALLRGPLSAAC